MKYKAFKEEEVPYRVLALFGLTREMIEDLPVRVLDSIYEGRISPALPIEVKDDKGNVFRSRSRFKLSRDEDGEVNVLFYPQYKHCDLEQYDDKQQEALLSGGAIVAVSPENKNVKCFVQIDPETNQVMYVPTSAIGKNLKAFMDVFEVSTQDILRMQAGEPVTITEGNEQLTAGIDLNDRTGIRIQSGDAKRWRKGHEADLDKYNFGLWGCWIKDDEGHLKHVWEEDYTDDILAEQQKVIDRNSSMRR